jgi:hypothetical protein
MSSITRSATKVFDKLGVPENERKEMYEAAQILIMMAHCR